MSGIHDATARAYGWVDALSCALTALGAANETAAAQTANAAARRSAAKREIDVLGKSRILMRKKGERGPSVDQRAGGDATARQRRTSRCNGVDHPRKDQMLDAKYACREGARVVGRKYRHRPLGDDPAAIVFIVDEVRGHAGDANSRLDHGTMHALAIHARPA